MSFLQRPWFEWIFDALVVTSIAGIYPRFIEPNFLFVSRNKLFLPTLPPALDGLKIVLFSDLHINQHSSSWFLRRLSKKISSLQPDVILFAGDLLTYSTLPKPELADEFFSSLSAPLGVFACLGNHDYASYISDVPEKNGLRHHPITHGLARLFGNPKKRTFPRSPRPLAPNNELLQLYAKTGVTVLHNETVHIGTGTHRINLTGIGDLSAGHFSPSKAYNGYNSRVPGITFGHSPDMYSFLSCYPGDLFCFGHTHGRQINIPILGDRISPQYDKSLKQGRHTREGRTIFVTRGVGATFPLRLFSPPQIVFFTLERKGPMPTRVRSPSLLEPNHSFAPYATQRQTSFEES